MTNTLTYWCSITQSWKGLSLTNIFCLLDSLLSCKEIEVVWIRARSSWTLKAGEKDSCVTSAPRGKCPSAGPRSGRWSCRRRWTSSSSDQAEPEQKIAKFSSPSFYTITIIHQLSIYTSMKHSLLLLKLLALALNSLVTLSGVRIKALTLLF